MAKRGPVAHTQETKDRIAIAMKAIRVADSDEERRRRNPGRPMSAETRAKISKAHLGMRHSDTVRARISASKKGKLEIAAIHAAHKINGDGLVANTVTKGD